VIVRLGNAEYSTSAPFSLSQTHCDSAWSLLNPVAWFGGCAEADWNNAHGAYANWYEGIQYGAIPRPQSLPAPPTAKVPVVQNTPTAAVPQTTAADWNDWTASQRAALQYAVDSGSWNPEGNLPLSALDLQALTKRYWPLLLAAGVFVFFKVRK